MSGCNPFNYPASSSPTQLRECRSRELRGGVLMTDCLCLRRNGLQYDCRRTGCQNAPCCSCLPAPLCTPSRVACQKHLCNPHAEAHAVLCRMQHWDSCCTPVVCYCYGDQGSGGKNKKDADPSSDAHGGHGAEKKENDNQLKRIKSRELRGGIMYYSCHCIKRNGLQHDCRRTGCGGEPPCLTMPNPICAPSQLARARGLADPAPLGPHMFKQGAGGALSGAADGSQTTASSGKRFVICELKQVAGQDSHQRDQPQQQAQKSQARGEACAHSTFKLDEKTMQAILNSLEGKEIELDDRSFKPPANKYPGGNKPLPPKTNEKPCTRPNCVHWKPPPPCVWNAPCKADCFETPPGLQPRY